MKETVLLFLVAVVSPGAAQTKMSSTKPITIHIDRLRVGTKPGECTYGQLRVGSGPKIADTLERPWEGGINLISSIPADTYRAKMRFREKGDSWRIELLDTKDRTAVQIHAGVSLSNTLGCILVGAFRNDPDKCQLEAKTDVYANFKRAILKEAMEPLSEGQDVNFLVVISDPPAK